MATTIFLLRQFRVADVIVSDFQSFTDCKPMMPQAISALISDKNRSHNTQGRGQFLPPDPHVNRVRHPVGILTLNAGVVLRLLPSYNDDLAKDPDLRLQSTGNPIWPYDNARELFDGIAQIIVDDAPNRAEFLARFSPGGPYEGTVGIFRRYTSIERIGVYDPELVMGLPSSVKWIAENGAGYDGIDVQACKERGIGLSNTPGVNDEATATATIYLIIATLRRFTKAERSLSAGTWQTPLYTGGTHDMSTRTIGILGLGRIGLHVAHLVHAFSMRVLYYSRQKRTDVPAWCEYVESVDALCAQSDVLSIHVLLNADTIGLVGERQIRAMKRGSIIINTARGKVLDESAVIRALEDGHLAGVGLDVFPDEPYVNPRLLEFPQNTLLPHFAVHSEDTEKKMEMCAWMNLRDFMVTGTGKDLVPELR